MTKIEEILEKLKHLSNEGKITWRPTVKSVDVFRRVWRLLGPDLERGIHLYPQASE